jgi:NAD(P)-dependent dehydrogenase (short-subunit alcohol dehydrogenase family)
MVPRICGLDPSPISTSRCHFAPTTGRTPLLQLNPYTDSDISTMASSQSTVVLISGGNTGIGFAVATKLAKDHGHHVIIGSRDANAGEEAARSLKTERLLASSVQLDITSDESIASAVGWIENHFGVLDVLINNAGILIDYVPGFTDASKDLSTRDLFSRTLGTNVIGTACLTEACLPLLHKSALPRVVFVSSRMGSLAESTNKSTMYYNTDYKSYDCSKAAVNILAVNVSSRSASPSILLMDE